MPPDLRLRRLELADADRVQHFVRALSAQTRVQRYFAPIRELSARQLDRVTSPRDPRDVALAAFAGGELIALAECAGGEFAVVVADAWQGLGIGEALMLRLLEHARERRLPALHGLVRGGNRAMLRLAARLGFRSARDADPGFVRVERALSHA
jgi:acetyltransferase